jgi:outer membrane biosynthesis protein TonB
MQKDIIIPQEKIIHEPPADSKAHSKAVEKEKGKEGEKEKGKEKEKEKEKQKEKEKEKEKDKKEKEHKEKDKEHKEKEKEHNGKEVAGEHGSKLHKELKEGVAEMVHKLSASAPSAGGGHGRPASAAAGTTVVTLAGENKGASMKIDGAALADGKADSAAGKERRGHKLDGSAVAGGKEQGGSKGLTAFVNSNVQVINNSLMLQSSCNGGDPGVHLKLSTKAKKKGDGGEEAGGKSGSASAAAPKK